MSVHNIGLAPIPKLEVSFDFFCSGNIKYQHSDFVLDTFSYVDICV